ncbi:MAG TPA: hypothetical protein DCX53_14000 [Anaerolineae bacterium]|nr:hypothetical protein [Anaerolineae bacterium]
MKRFSWFEILLIVVVTSTSLFAALSDAQNLSMRWFVRDDAYYYFKVAQNISEGHGSTFDGINQTNGYHPLWLWICVPIFALARFDLVLPLRILFLVMSGLSVATGILLYRLIGRVFVPAIGAIAAIYWVFSTDVLERVYQQGLETGIAAFSIVLFIYKLYYFERSWRNNPVTKKQLATLGILAILVTFSRLDLVFFAAMAGIWIVFRRHPMRYFVPLDIVAITVTVLLGFIIRVSFDEYLKYSNAAVTMIAISLVVKIIGAFLFGLYQHPYAFTRIKMAKSLILFGLSTAGLTGILMTVVTPLANFEGFPRTIIVYDFVLTTLVFGFTRYAALGLKSDIRNTHHEVSPIRQIAENWKYWLADGLTYFGILGGAMSLYMIWNKAAFGTSSPVSGQIKRWWGSLSGKVYGGSAQTPLTFFGIDYLGESNTWHPVSSILGYWAEIVYKFGILDVWRYLIILTLFAAFFYIVLMTNKNFAKNAIVKLGIIPIFCGAWIQVLSYHVTGYSAFKEWYWISQLVTVVLVLSLIVGILFKIIQNQKLALQFLWLATAGTFLVMVSSYWGFVQHKMPYNHWAANEPYNDLAAFLEEHTDPGSIIGMTGGGNAGYFITDRTVINMDGLINSHEYFELLQNREAGAFLAEIGMDYILANQTLLDQLPYKRQFSPYIRWMNLRYGGKELVRYTTDIQE